jgi:DNA-3-methyladenine glycosylase II
MSDWTPGVAHLKSSDARLAALIERIGPPDLHFERDAWRSLSSAIIGQQISTHAARAIRGRFAALGGGPDGFTSTAQVLAASEEDLRGCGLSRGKVLSLRDLAAHFEDGRIKPESFADLDDEAIIAALIPVRGIGRWTAEMFLMFSLGRPDVWAVDDLGLRVGVQKLHEMDERPNAKQMAATAAPWQPWRSLASWYLWRSLDAVPKVAATD